jgi:hypothetical protein
MDVEFFRQQAVRIRDLAAKADPFTRKRLLDLAERYDATAGNPSRASRTMGRPISLPLNRPADAQSGEA